MNYSLMTADTSHFLLLLDIIRVTKFFRGDTKLLLWIYGLIGSMIIRFLGFSARKCVEIDDEAEKLLKENKPLIFSLFHSQIIFPIFYHRNSNIDILVSNSKDGEIISKIVSFLGYGSCTGSARKGGTEAALSMISAVDNNRKIGFTVDGPLGPKFIVKQGIIWLASYKQIPILPITYSAKPSIVFNSWDNFILPLPFAKIKYKVDKPFYVPQIFNDEQKIEEYRLKLEKIMLELTDKIQQ
ncbi:MAG: lysophospholipid acyltransferase family protein [Candidatus Hydrogenedentota bacterium]